MFCGGSATTKEHAWPAWLLRELPASTGAIVELERGGVAVPPWQTAAPETTLKFLCASCNNGWMSELENRAKPIIISLLRESELVLTLDDQITLARWTIKTAMVFEALRVEQAWFFSPAERAEVRHGRFPSTHVAVWAAKCVDLAGMFCYGETAAQGPSEARAYVTTMAFGSVALQVLVLRPAPSVPAPAGTNITVGMRAGPWNRATVQVAPAEGPVRWPPEIGLNSEHGVEQFRRRFRT